MGFELRIGGGLFVMPEINVWAALAAAASSFLLGGLWYSPALFAKPWMRETGLTEADLRNANPATTFGVSFVLSAIAALVFLILGLVVLFNAS